MAGKKETILWLCVTIISLIIAALWGWSLYLQFSLVHISKSPEGTLFQKTKTAWDKAFSAASSTPQP